MRLKLPVIILITSLSLGCVHPKPIVQTITVDVPIKVNPIPPESLLSTLTPDLPTFVSPTDPQASSALTSEGERLFRALINDLLTRIQAWTDWAVNPNPGK